MSEEQEGCRRGSHGTNNQLLIDKTALKDCKKRNTDWRDYKKAYDFVPHSYINECTESLGIANNVIIFLDKSIEQWKLLLTSIGEDRGEVDVKREIF